MPILKIAAAIVAPAVFWLGYFYYKDRFNPEPLLHLIVSYLLGILSGLLCLGFYGFLAGAGVAVDSSVLVARVPPLEFLSHSVILVGLLEEIFKFLPFGFILVRLKAFNEPIDGIVYAAAVAIGFASFENLGYLPLMHGFEFFGRAVASPLTHTAFASIWGYAIGKAHLSRKPILPAAVLGIGLASLCHGLYNFLNFSVALRCLSALLILVVWAWGIKTLEKQA